ncbi:reverse transcriptase domain-containing protein [Tanacetum coccineum]
MRTRSQTRNRNHQQQAQPAVVEPFHLEEPFVNPPLVPIIDNRTMAQLLQAPTEGYEDAIVIPEINANFELKHELHQLDTFYNALNANDQDSLNSAAGGNFLDKMPRECLRIIESKSKVRNSRNKAVVAKVSSNSSTGPPIAMFYRDNIQEYVFTSCCTNFNQEIPILRPPKVQIKSDLLGFSPIQNIKTVSIRIREIISTKIEEPISIKTVEVTFIKVKCINQPPTSQPPVYQAQPYQAPAQQMQGVSKTYFENYVKANDVVLRNMQNQGQGSLPSNTVTNPKEDLKGITTQSGVVYQGPTTTTSSPTNNGITEDVQPPVVPVKNQNPVYELVDAPVSVPMPNPKPSIPYPSRRNDEKHRENAKEQKEKFYEIFKDMSFKISFMDALTLMSKFASTLKALIGNKEKLSEMARTPLNEHCSAVILNKLPEKLGDPGRFLIPCKFPGMYVCLALADLGASINLMPFFMWKKLNLPNLTLTCITLELADRSISQPIGIAKDVNVKFGAFQFPSDFVEVLGFSDVIASGNPTPYYDPIVSNSSPTLTPFGDSDFLLLEEADAFLALADDPTSPEVDESYYDPEGDILILEALLNSDPLPPPNQGNYLPEIRKELKICEAKTAKSSIDEPPEVELKDLPPHLEYAFLEDNNKLPVIIAKDLSIDEKTALIKVLKSRKRAIAWKLSDIKGINPEFCSHKILMEEDYEPAVQHQRRVNPKIHDVIKKEVEKLLDAGLIYPISDSPWVSPVHCVPKKGGMTVVTNDENELVPTRLVTGWRVCIDYRKLNEATRKDHFPLPFMDQMLERLAGNEYYCFLDGFSGYFQIPIDPKDQEKTTFTCPYKMFAYRCIPFSLCNAPGTFHMCMMASFHYMIEKTMKVFMDEFSVFRNSFSTSLSNLDKMLKWCEDTNLALNWEKIHFMVKEGIVLGHKISMKGIEVDKSKIDVIAKLPHPTTVKGAVLGQRIEKHSRPIHNASKTMTEAESNYTTTEKEKLAVVYAFEKFRSYLIMNKSIVYTDHSALNYLFAKLLRWVLLLQEFDFNVVDTKGAENLAEDHLSRHENTHKDVLENKNINEHFPLENLGVISNKSTPWFADYANFHAGNFIIKGMSTQQKRKFFKDDKHYF